MSSDIAGDFSSFQDDVYSAIMSTVKAVSSLASTDIPFQRSSDPDFASTADATSARILSFANQLFRSAAGGSDVEPPVLKDEDDIENKWRDIVEVADFLLEKADTCLDEYTGAIKQKNPEPLPGAIVNRGLSRTQKKGQAYRANTNSALSRNLAKPQLLFRVKVDNMDNSPFRPLLTAKPHAKVPLEESFEMFTNESGNMQYIHPYIEEIKSMEYPEHLFQKREPKPYLPFDETGAIYVDSSDTLLGMLSELKQAKEIAVDLEHHDQRSYIGFVCLMQISTRDKDWIVDTLELREELQVLNEVFADPEIIKVFHGSQMDIIWLQRDFGLYVVGLFDTYWAARTLGFQGHGLAFLLKKYADFDADKQYQLADWRLRPLPVEMFNYARSDTHFLLYCFDHVRNELLDHWIPNDPENDKMTHVLRNSKETALRLYEREPYDEVHGDGVFGWQNMIGRSSESFSPMQLSVFKAVHQWRDTTARIEDESTYYMMPRHQLFNLARKMPIDVAGVLGCCSRPSPPVKIRAGELVVVIRNAKDAPEVREWQKSLEAMTAATESATEHTARTSEGRPFTDIFDPAFEQSGTIRAQKSGFWGNCDESSRWSVVSGKKQDEGQLRLAVPLPQLTAAVFVSHDDKAAPKKSFDPGARAEHEYVKRSKRKLEATAMSAAQGEPNVDEDTEVKEANAATPASGRGNEQLGSAALTPGGGKHKEKSRKKKKQEDVTGDSAAASRAAEGQAFDYASAPSVLNAKPSTGTDVGKKEGKKEKKPFNPYAGSRNVPKGLSRENKERAGRSSTFKR